MIDGVFYPPYGWAYRLDCSGAKDLILNAVRPSQRSVNWPPFLLDIGTMRAQSLQDRLVQTLERNGRQLIVSISHDQYLTTPGGVQNVVGDEHQWAKGAGWNYLHICPNSPRLALGPDGVDGETQFIVSLNGMREGVATLHEILAAFAPLKRMDADVRMVVHHLLGVAPEHVLRLWEVCSRHPMIFWVHDLFSLCPSIHLLRNDAVFCNAPPPSSPACRICHAGDERPGHLARLQHFFEAAAPIVVAPSETILEFWRKHGNYRHTGSRVLPPAVLYLGESSPKRDAAAPLRIGFMGAPGYAKGWHVFESLARWHCRDPRYEFYLLGWAPAAVPGLRYVPVKVTRDDREAMVRTARDIGLDVVIHWSMCYESFSFTLHEALAAGVYIVSRPGSGNVERVIESQHGSRGCIVSSEAMLCSMFEEGSIRERVDSSDRRYGGLRVGSGVGPLLAPESVDA